MKGFIYCGAILDSGKSCRRRLRPGERCVDHGTLAPPDGSEPQSLSPEPCICSRPIRWTDELGSRCTKCGHWVDPPEKRRRGKPPKAPAQKAASDPGPLFLPEQLELDI